MQTSEAVVERYLVLSSPKQAAAIGDPKDFLSPFESTVDSLVIPPADIEESRAFLKFYGTQIGTGGTWDYRDKENAAKLRKADDLASKAYFSVLRGWQKLSEHGHKLFLSILQTLALPPAIRKKVEMASRAYLKQVKPRVKNKGYLRTLEYFDIYEKFMAAVQQDLATAKKAIASGKAHSEEGPSATKVRVGKFVLVNTGGFDQKVMANIVDVMKKVETLAESSGFGSVCYGEVQVTNKINKGTLAFYLVAQDELFVRADVKSDVDTVRTVLHELGHRFEHKSLTGRRRDVERLYQMLNGQEYDHQKKLKEQAPKSGEVWVSPKGSRYQVLFTERSRGGVTVHMKREDNPLIQAKISLEGYLEGKGGGARNVDEDPNFKGFITPYAKSGGPGENFAEMFSFYCLGRLPVLQSQAFEALCFDAEAHDPDRIFFARRVMARWLTATMA